MIVSYPGDKFFHLAFAGLKRHFAPHHLLRKPRNWRSEPGVGGMDLAGD